MPRVGKKKFPYTKKGIADAKAYAKKNDLPIIYTEDNKAGMAVPGYAEGGGVRFYETQYTAPEIDFHKPEGYGTGDASGSGSGKEKSESENKEGEYVEPSGCPEGQESDGQGGCVPIEGEKDPEKTTTEEEDDPIVIPEDVENYEPPEIEEETETDEELGLNKPVEQETPITLEKRPNPESVEPTGGFKKPEVIRKPSDEYIPQSTFGEGENPNIGRAEGGYSHEARNMVPQTQKPKIELPKSDTGGGGGLANLTGGGDGESLADKIKDKASGDGGGGGLSSLGETIKEKTEEIGDSVEAKKVAVVKANKKKQKLTPLQIRARDFLNKEKANRAKLKTNTPGRKMHKGGRVKANKKGVAIIIAVGKPKVNRKKK